MGGSIFDCQMVSFSIPTSRLDNTMWYHFRLPKTRRITRLVDEDLLDEMQRRIEDNPDLLTKHKDIVEHPFGTIKWSMDQGHFLMKGIPKTSAEMSLSFLAYNIKRVINILGVPKMIEALG